jgi:hypothetical protein
MEGTSLGGHAGVDTADCGNTERGQPASMRECNAKAMIYTEDLFTCIGYLLVQLVIYAKTATRLRLLASGVVYDSEVQK